MTGPRFEQTDFDLQVRNAAKSGPDRATIVTTANHCRSPKPTRPWSLSTSSPSVGLMTALWLAMEVVVLMDTPGSSSTPTSPRLLSATTAVCHSYV
jgi:hypothetical protein